MLEELVSSGKRRLVSLDATAALGMGLAYGAAEHPDRVAIHSARGSHTFAELNARANQVARVLRESGVRRATASR